MAIDKVELKRIADGLLAIGKPSKTESLGSAVERLALMVRFEKLVRAATPAERGSLVLTLKEMLEETR